MELLTNLGTESLGTIIPWTCEVQSTIQENYLEVDFNP